MPHNKLIMNQPQELYFKLKNEWRGWLSDHHQQKDAVWLVYYKKESGKPTISYNDSVEQALCFGWIDGIIKSIDDEKYKRKFMPRTNFYNWSPSNRKRVEKLIKSGEMIETGLNTIGDYQKTKQLVWPETQIQQPELTTFSDDLWEILKADKKAWDFFNSLSASHKNRYFMWVMHAKKEETRIKRMNEALELLRNSTKNLIK